MMSLKKTVVRICLIPTLLVPVLGHAVDTYQSRNEASAYVGAQWYLGETRLTKPNLVLGYRQTQTDSSNEVTGFDLTYTYSLEKSASDAVRLGYVAGKCQTLGTAGVGYSFAKNTALAYLGALAPYAKLFGEVDGNKNLGAALELNTQDCAGDRKTTTTDSGPI